MNIETAIRRLGSVAVVLQERSFLERLDEIVKQHDIEVELARDAFRASQDRAHERAIVQIRTALIEWKDAVPEDVKHELESDDGKDYANEPPF